MMNAEARKKQSLMRRRTIAIAVVAVVIVILTIALIWVLDFVKTTTFEDVDGTKYYIRYKEKTYAMYDSSKKQKLPTDSEKGYYVTLSGTLVEVNPETGEYTVQAVVDTEGNEVVGFNSRLLLFPHIEKKEIRSLEVHNDHGTFTFERYNLSTGQVDNTSDFVIRGAELNAYNQELFASLYVSAGYTISTRKIQNPIKDENGLFSEYGLVEQTRLREKEADASSAGDSEDGVIQGSTDDDSTQMEEYLYKPAYYVLTDTSGNKYKVIVGDRLVTGGGYYVQYIDMRDGTEKPREAVYVLSADIAESLLVPIENFVTPMISYPMSMNNYFDVENFLILHRDDDAKHLEGFSFGYTENVAFSYVDLEERENTIRASIPYIFNEGSKSPAASLAGYYPSSNNINSCLQSLYSPSYAGVRKLSPGDDDFIKYGLMKPKLDENGEQVLDKDGNPDYELCPEYIITFDFDVTEEGQEPYTISQRILISAPNENGNYYIFTFVYDDEGESLYDYNMIVEVEGHTLAFLKWDAYDWIEDSYFNLNIAFCQYIKLESGNYTAEFSFDNSRSDSSSAINSNLLRILATDSGGNNRNTFSDLQVVDLKGNLWVITASDIKAYSPTGTELKITTSKYAYNVMGTQVLTVSGYIECNNGDQVEVGTDIIRIKHSDNTVEEIVRYDTNLFRKFYQTLLYASIVDSYPMEEADRQELLADSSKLLLTLTVRNTEGEEFVYRFYELTSRKAYITVNGNGSFYVLRNRIDKFISDAQRFFNLEMIEATDKR